MTVSVLLPTHARNEGGFLSRAIASVLNQTYADLELIVLDDASHDGSQNTIASFAARDPRMQTIRFETPIGLPALTGAHGYLASRGNYIAWQFDDCEWAPHLLQTLLGAAAAAPEAGLIYGRAYYPDETRDGLLGGLITRAELETGRNVIPNCVTLVPRHVHETLGWLDPHILLKRNCDWDMWTRI